MIMDYSQTQKLSNSSGVSGFVAGGGAGKLSKWAPFGLIF